MKIELDAKKIAIILWVVFSALYIVYDVYASVRFGLMQNAYQSGRVETVNALITQATNKDCQPFNVYSGDNKVDLINVACLKQAQAPNTSTAATNPAK